MITRNSGLKRSIGGFDIRFPIRYARYYEANYEPVTFNFLSNNLSEGDIYLDCGGHLGLFAIVAARLVGEKGRVFSFEPTPLSRSVLEQVVALNNCKNIVEVRPEAVSEASGTAIFFDTGTEVSNANSLVKTDKHGEGLKVKTVSLDDFVFERAIKHVNCMKIDVEGSELDALRGAKKVIETYRPNISLGLHPFAFDKPAEKLSEIWDVLNDYKLAVKYEGKAIDKDWFTRQTKIFDVQCFAVKL